MPIEVACTCGKSLRVPDKVAGKKVKCPSCGTSIAVPASSVAPADTPIRCRCECGKALAVPSRLAGKTIKCPACQQPVRVPAGEAALEESDSSSQEGVDGLSDVEGVASLLDEAKLTASATGRRCPDCRTDMLPDDVICVNCGFNTETGRKLGTRRTGRKEAHKPIGRFQTKSTGGKYTGVLKVVGLVLVIGVAAFLALRTAGIWP